MPPTTLTNSFKFASSHFRNVSRPISRVLSLRFPAMDDHSSGAFVAEDFARPTRAVSRKQPRAEAHTTPIRSCSRWGLPCRNRCRPRGALLPHRFTLAAGKSRERSNFCGTFPRVAPAGCYPAPCFRGARTFLPRTLSGLAGAAIQPTDALTYSASLLRSTQSVLARILSLR